jgi:hypothetical protein
MLQNWRKIIVMKTARWLLLLLTVLSMDVQAQQEQAFDQVTSRAFLRQLDRDGVYNFISSRIAESLLTRRVEPVLPHGGMIGRFSGTVIVAFELSKDGTVLHPMAVSGPALLRPPVLAAVRQWRFKPYQVRGEPVAVATSVPIQASNW